MISKYCFVTGQDFAQSYNKWEENVWEMHMGNIGVNPNLATSSLRNNLGVVALYIFKHCFSQVKY